MTAPDADAAWAKVEVPLPPDALLAFLGDVERLFRINPQLELERVTREGEDTLHLLGRNESSEQPVELRARVVRQAPGSALVLRYDGGIKRETRFGIEPAPGGATLTITETYDTPRDAEREAYLRQVDRSLIPWAAAIRDHLRNRVRWGWVPGHARYMERFWLGMTPRQRRVTRLIVWITALEFVAFLFVFAIWWNGMRVG
jgi:hypothetical protein